MQKTRSVDVEHLLTQLTSDCIERVNRGEEVDMEHYRQQLPDQETRKEFDEVIRWSTVLTVIEDSKREAQ